MFQGKMKAVTFSFDDGVQQDKKLIRLFDKYGLHCTFNLNSGLFDTEHPLVWEGRPIERKKISACEVHDLYQGHEVAVHTLHHPALYKLSDEEIIKEVEEDRLRLSELAGYNVVGMAYPSGICDDRVANVIRENTGIKYARTVVSTFNYEPQDNLYLFDPSVHFFEEFDQLEKMAEEFVALRADKPQIFYIWGHAYAFDMGQNWDRFEKVCALLANRSDTFYGTNRQVLLGDI